MLNYANSDNLTDYYCGGVIIHESYILTSAHCVLGKEITSTHYTLTSVRLGDWNITGDVDCFDGDCNEPQTVTIVEQIVHPKFSPESLTSQHNIALLRLERPLAFNDFIRPICLPQSDKADESLGELEISGWALTRGGMIYYSALKTKF